MTPASLDLAALRSRLPLGWVGAPLEWRPSLDSTNEEVLRRAAAGAAPGLTVLADSQTAGRGRRGRPWRDRPGQDLLCSVLLPAPPPALFPVACGLVLADAFAALSAAPVQVQWPNDLVLAGAKLGGLLLEVRSGHAVLGLGLNLLGDAAALSRELGRPLTTLQAAAARPLSREDTLLACLGALEYTWRTFTVPGASLPTELREARDCLRGRLVTVHHPAGTCRGRAAGLAPDGALLVDTATGRATLTVADRLDVEAEDEAQDEAKA